MRVTEVHVDELFSALRGIVVHLPRSPGVTVVFEDLNGVPTLRTDAFKLSQILRNYVVNGLKFTERGEVRISAAAVDAGQQVRFAVADTGPGLRVADQARVFEEFVQLGRPGEAGELRGSGLGLSICKRLATLLGGEVGVDQRAGPRDDLHGDDPGDLRAGQRGRGGHRRGVTCAREAARALAYNRRAGLPIRVRWERRGSQYSAGWCNGSTTVSGIVSLGSNPSPAAVLVRRAGFETSAVLTNMCSCRAETSSSASTPRG